MTKEKELMERLEQAAVPAELAALVAEMSDEQVRSELRRLEEVLVSGKESEEGEYYLYALLRELKHRNDALRERIEAGDDKIAKLRAEIRKLEEKNAALSEFKAELDARMDELNRSAKRPGRNEPCPCGSGKKYKHCCGK